MDNQPKMLEGRLGVTFDPETGFYTVPFAANLYEYQGKKLCDVCNYITQDSERLRFLRLTLEGQQPSEPKAPVKVGQLDIKIKISFENGKPQYIEDAQGRRYAEGEPPVELKEWQVKNCDECRAANT